MTERQGGNAVGVRARDGATFVFSSISFPSQSAAVAVAAAAVADDIR